MLQKTVSFVYEGPSSVELREVATWLIEVTGRRSLENLEALIDNYFGGSWLGYRLCLEKMTGREIELSLAEAQSVRNLLAALLAEEGLKFSDAPGLAAAPLLRDLSSLQSQGQTRESQGLRAVN